MHPVRLYGENSEYPHIAPFCALPARLLKPKATLYIREPYDHIILTSIGRMR